jgi:hypothetical protein
MQISADFDSLHEQLQEIKSKIEKKMTGMVQNFTYNLTVEAIDITPFNRDFDHTRWMYFNPTRLAWGLGVTPGHAKGGWVLSINDKSNNRWGRVAEDENAFNVKNAADDSSMEYKLGDSVYIVNNVPYVSKAWPLPNYNSLESGYSNQAPNGIWGPVTAAAYIYAQDLKRMYDQA